MTIQLKLVIWDLDNTLWRGTLAEGDTPILIPERAELIKNLTDMGVVNSICSKNDFEKAKKVLIEFGIWDYFVFPKISFEPKGHLIQSILNEMHLRAENTIFIDDEIANLNEALYYNPKINLLPESNCEDFFNFINKNTNAAPIHSRLQHYKQLENKTIAQNSFSSNEDFLRSSNIKLEFVPVTNEELFNRLLD